MSRLGLRTRVTLAFSIAMALVLTALGLFLYSRHSSQLTEAINQGLRSRAGEITALVRDSPNALRGSARSLVIEREESFAQVLDERGRVLDSTPQLRGIPVLNSEQVADALDHRHYFERDAIPGIERGGRLLATPIQARGRRLVAVVGASLGDRKEALANLSKLLLLGGLGALALSSLAGFLAVTAALRPVEAMRRRAAEISSGLPDERLPVPPTRDALGRLGKTLNAMLARLQAAIERERRFVDDASHELRTPLALHKAELELALRYDGDEAELRRAIASSAEEVDRLIALAESLLLLARSAEGELALDRRVLGSAELLEAARGRFAARAGKLTRAIEIGGEDARLEGDPARLEQALTGLIDNALRHGQGTVRLSAQVANGAVRLHVADAGPGFDEEFLPRAFERFSREDTARGRGGTGLGLAIVDAIARAHGGRAGAANLPDGGAGVWIELPRPRT